MPMTANEYSMEFDDVHQDFVDKNAVKDWSMVINLDREDSSSSIQ